MPATRTIEALTFLFAACGPHAAKPASPPPARDRFASLRAAIDSARDPETRLVATARLADALWDASCPRAEARLCVSQGTAPSGHLYCSGDEPPATTTATPRGPEADEAKDLYRRIARASATDPDGKRAVTGARLALADADAEAFYAITPPDSAADFKHLFGPWREESEEVGQKAIAQYVAIVSDGDTGEASVIAAAQIARLTYELGWRTITLPVPDDIAHSTDPTMTHAFCDELGDQVAPIFPKATEAFRACATRAAQIHASGPIVDMCRRASPYPS